MKTRAFVNTGKWAGARIASALDRSFGPRGRRCFGILIAHRVSAHPPGVPPPTVNVQPDMFRSQIDGLLAAGFEFWPLAKVIDSAQRRNVPRNVVVLTFDDGYRSVYENVWPLLRSRDIPATIFVATSFIGTNMPFPFDAWAAECGDGVPTDAWRPLSWDECREMEGSGLVEVGSHSHTHADFRGRPDALAADLDQSRVTLDRELGARPRPFAFPFGSVKKGFADPALAAVVRGSNFTCALTTEIELAAVDESPFRWGRIEVADDDTPATLRAKLNGWYSWMNSARSAYWRTRRWIR